MFLLPVKPAIAMTTMNTPGMPVGTGVVAFAFLAPCRQPAVDLP